MPIMEISEQESSGVCMTLWLVFAAAVLLIIYLAWNYTYFLRRGIPGPLPFPILGNILDWREGVQYSVDGYIKKYGNCCGFYQFLTPSIVVSDPDMVKQIMVKHFDRFHNRMYIPIHSPLLSKALFISRDGQWKKIRRTLIHAFSGRKMKLMSEIVRQPANRLVHNFKAACGKDRKAIVECKELFGAYIMDTIGLCAFGLNVDSQRNKDDPFVLNAKRFFGSLDFTSPAMVFSMVTSFIPGSTQLLNWLGVTAFPGEVLEFFKAIIDKEVDMRKTDKAAKNVDFLQLMIDSTKDNEGDDDGDNNNATSNVTTHVSETKSNKRDPLTKQELMSQALAFFIAGYETTTTALCFTAYLLATNPDQQDRLIAEIDRLAPTAEDVTYENLKKLTFLENVISESMRLYPPGVLIDRVCNQTTTINGHVFRAGDAIAIPIWSIHRDPKHWPNPEKFDPDRFTKENQAGRAPLAWLPFGGGPRFCIGLRFAMMEIRTALVMMLQNFRLEVCPETEVPPVLGKVGFINPPNGVTLRLVERNK